MPDPSLGTPQGTNPPAGSNKVSTFNYRYPLTKLTSADDYLKIDIFEYIPPGFEAIGDTFALPSSDSVGYSDIKGTIILPIPETIQDSNVAMWGESFFNPIAGSVARVVQEGLNSNSIDEARKKAKGATEALFGAASSGSTQKYLQALGITLGTNVLLGGSGTDVGKAASRLAGVVANSNIELIFTGVTLREGFSFSFDIVPRSQKEAEEVKQIIRTFKKTSAVQKGAASGAAAGLFLKAPNVYRIQYMSGGRPHPYLNKYKMCALRGMTVNYTGGGTYATYSDATPISMQMTLSFQELTPIYAEDYDTTIGSEGVGY
jgi:hypothetical protein